MSVRVEILKINSEEPEVSLIRYVADQIRAGEVRGTDQGYRVGAGVDDGNDLARRRVLLQRVAAGTGQRHHHRYGYRLSSHVPHPGFSVRRSPLPRIIECVRARGSS